MTIDLTSVDAERDACAERYFDDLETALFVQTIAASTDATPERRKALLGQMLAARFTAAVAGYSSRVEGFGALSWHEDGTLRHLLYESPTGLTCSLGRAYLQPNGSWAALVIAGVAADEYAAMARCEWAIARLAA